MKKFFLSLMALIIYFPHMANADVVSAGIDPMELCPQLYIHNPAYQGSVADCKKLWDYYAQTKNDCGMALMALDGEGGAGSKCR